MEHAMHELKLNVSQFYQDDEVRQLLMSEEAPPFPGAADEDFYIAGERYYEVDEWIKTENFLVRCGHSNLSDQPLINPCNGFILHSGSCCNSYIRCTSLHSDYDDKSQSGNYFC